MFPARDSRHSLGEGVTEGAAVDRFHLPRVGRQGPVKKFLRVWVACSDSVKTDPFKDPLMADFLVVLGIVAFALVMLGLIWALERV
jgi:hypothetical protein